MILLFYISDTVGQVSCLRLPVRLSSDLLLLLPNIEKSHIHMHTTTLAQLLHTLYSRGQKQGNRSVFFMHYHLALLMLLLFVCRKQYQTCAHISYSDTLYDPTVQPCLLIVMFMYNCFALANTLSRN